MVPDGKFNRVKVNIANKFLQIQILLADNRLIPVLPPARRAYASERKS